MDTGDLDTRVSILQKAAGKDAAGQSSTTWNVYAELWANIKHIRGYKAIQADQDVSVTKTSITVRRRDDITVVMRLRDDATGALYNIIAILPDRETREWTNLICQLGGVRG